MGLSVKDLGLNINSANTDKLQLSLVTCSSSVLSSHGH